MNKELILYHFFKQYIETSLSQNFDHIEQIKENALNITEIESPSSFLKKKSIYKDFFCLNYLHMDEEHEKRFISSNWTVLSRSTDPCPDHFYPKISYEFNPQSSIDDFAIINPMGMLDISTNNKEMYMSILSLYIDNTPKTGEKVFKSLSNYLTSLESWNVEIVLFCYILFPNLRNNLPDVSNLYNLLDKTYSKEMLKIKTFLL